MKSSAPRRGISKAAIQALLNLVSERFPVRAQKLLLRLRKGAADAQQELLVPARMMVYSLLGERCYEQYTGYEGAALRGDAVAETAWLRMLSVCRLLLRRPGKTPVVCWN